MAADRFDELMRQWDGELVVSGYDRQTGASMFICVHSTTAGPAAGGVRMREYPSALDAMRDGMRLSEAMTLKMAICGAPLGGGKSVIDIDPSLPSDMRRLLLRRYAQMLESLHGTYFGAPDMNTGPADMDLIYEHSSYVFCRSPERGGSGNTSYATALGVFHSIKAAAGHALDSDDLAGRTVLVQGVGAVGEHLVGMLVDCGARVLVGDVATHRVAAVVERYDVTPVDPDDIVSTACDVYAPCATGGILNRDTIPLLRCSVVAGAANNQLATSEDDLRLRDRGILYAPDFVTNAGGVLHGVGLELWNWTPQEVAVAAEGLGGILREIFAEADTTRTGTQATAERLARAKLAAAASAPDGSLGAPAPK